MCQRKGNDQKNIQLAILCFDIHMLIRKDKIGNFVNSENKPFTRKFLLTRQPAFHCPILFKHIVLDILIFLVLVIPSHDACRYGPNQEILRMSSVSGRMSWLLLLHKIWRISWLHIRRSRSSICIGIKVQTKSCVGNSWTRKQLQ